ncbi:MAG: SCP2 sterol-binding domain-containing protein [Pseudomonadales bacterium]|nr:SCP2 sterol-binding domain-containing protein [Pseudomonadales bacterium]
MSILSPLLTPLLSPLRATKVIKLLTRGSLLAAEVIIAETLKRDPVSRKKLKKLDGKRIAIHTTMPEFKLVLAFYQESIKLLSDSDSVDAEISCSFSNLLQLLTSSNPATQLHSGEIKLSGDSHLIDEMHSILADLDLDWEALLATLVGDSNAHVLGNASRTGWNWHKQRSASLVLDIEEYVKEEAQWLPPKPAATRFFSEVDQIRLDAERLKARVDRLSKRAAATPQNSSEPEPTDPENR